MKNWVLSIKKFNSFKPTGGQAVVKNWVLSIKKCNSFKPTGGHAVVYNRIKRVENIKNAILSNRPRPWRE